MRIDDLGLMSYGDAWKRQEQAHEEVLQGGHERLLLVEHPPVVTFGRRDGSEKNLLATPEQLASRHVELVKSDRGGDITLHAPGQLVAYPILRLNDHRLSVGGYVHLLEQIVIDVVKEFGVVAHTDPKAVGVWVSTGVTTAKICAIGVRIRRGVSLHGLALNVTTDLSLFDLIVPCGLEGRLVTSLAQQLGCETVSINDVKDAIGRCFTTCFSKVGLME